MDIQVMCHSSPKLFGYLHSVHEAWSITRATHARQEERCCTRQRESLRIMVLFPAGRVRDFVHLGSANGSGFLVHRLWRLPSRASEGFTVTGLFFPSSLSLWIGALRLSPYLSVYLSIYLLIYLSLYLSTLKENIFCNHRSYLHHHV